jgi:hypothetical protein
VIGRDLGRSPPYVVSTIDDSSSVVRSTWYSALPAGNAHEIRRRRFLFIPRKQQSLCAEALLPEYQFEILDGLAQCPSDGPLDQETVE